MATPNKSDPIRCGMCGKLNSADRAMCEYCGARLRPMTPEEMGLTPSESKDSGEGLPPTPGATDTLHMRFEEVEEDTVIGPSAAKAQREREQKAPEEEPDFTFGRREEEPSGDVPDWLREASKPTDEPEAAGDLPDWLSQETEAEAPSPIEIPDWLGADSATQPPAPRASEEDMPDWLRAADERDREEPARADRLSDTARSESTQPMPRTDETPDWLHDMPEPAAAEPSKPPGGAPDWLTEIKEERQEETPDWLRAPEDTGYEEPPQPSAPPPPKRSGVTDWLRGLGVEPTAEEIKAALPPTPEPPPTEQPPVEPPQAKPVRPMSSIPLDETPDWLLALESQTPEEAAEAPDEQLPATQEAAPEEPEEPPTHAEPSVPDWLRAEESQSPPSAAEWLSELSGEGAPAASQPEETPGEAPDWMRAPEDQTPTEMPQAEAPSAPTDISDWLSGMGAESAAPAEAPESEVSGTGAEEMAPDWLRAPDEEAPVTPPEAPAQAEPPDWLSGMGAEAAQAPSESEHELPPLASMGSMPDWLRAPEETPAETPQAEAPPAPIEMPDWLTGMGAETASPAQAEANLSDSEEPAPDWLRAPEEAPSEMPWAEAPPAPSEVPDWLSGMAAEPPAPAEVPVADTETGLPEGLGEAPASAEPAIDVPDWLHDAGAPATLSEEPAPPVEPAAPAGEVQVPDWLSDLGGAPTTPPENVPEAPAAEQPVEVPDWLGNLAAPSIPEPQTPEATAPSAEVEAPDWLSDLGAGQPASPPTAEPSDDLAAPDWLSDLGTAAETPAEMPFATETATPLGDEEAPDWLNMMDLELPDTGLGKPSGGEDLLGLSEDLLTPEEVREEEEAELTSADLPEWLREAAPGEKPTPGSAPLIPSKELPPEVAAELEGLRFEAVTGERGDEKITEKVGALKDVTGVIRPELLFDGASLRADELIDQVIITNDQARRVQAVQSMLDREAEGVFVAGQRQSVVPVVRWLIVLVLVASVAAAQFTRILPEPSAGAAPNDAHTFIADLPADSTVIVAFEYEPDTAAEMQPLAEALLSDLAQRSDITVLALSTRPTGAAMAQSAMAALERTPSSWANVGYISGGPTGISALTNGVLPGFDSPLQRDYRGKTLNTEATHLSDLEPGLIIVLAARSEYLRAWIEQAGSPMQTPVIAAVSAGVSPLAYPYQQSGQLVAVLSGINDAVSYNALEGGSGESEVVTTWNAQGVGGAAAAALILIGGVIYGLRALRQQREQG